MLYYSLINPTLVFLNEAFAADPELLSHMLSTRFPCNDAILNHSSIQADGPTRTLNILGFINGLLGTHDCPGEAHHLHGPICAVYDAAGNLQGFDLTENYF